MSNLKYNLMVFKTNHIDNGLVGKIVDVISFSFMKTFFPVKTKRKSTYFFLLILLMEYKKTMSFDNPPFARTDSEAFHKYIEEKTQLFNDMKNTIKEIATNRYNLFQMFTLDNAHLYRIQNIDLTNKTIEIKMTINF